MFLERQWWADAPMNDGLFVRWELYPQTFWVCGRLLPGGIRDAKATHLSVFCESGLGRLPSGSCGFCLSFDVNESGGVALLASRFSLN